MQHGFPGINGQIGVYPVDLKCIDHYAIEYMIQFPAPSSNLRKLRFYP